MRLIGEGSGAKAAGEGLGAGLVPGAGERNLPNLGGPERCTKIIMGGGPFKYGGVTVVEVHPGSRAGGGWTKHQVGPVAGAGAITKTGGWGGDTNIVACEPAFV